MPTKKYCLVPETSKLISVYNANTITSLQQLPNVNPDAKFRYCIDEFDKIKLFYIGNKESGVNTDDETYFKYKIVQSIKSIFKITEISDFNFNATDGKVEFTVYYDVDGNHIEELHLASKNKYNTVLAHRYTYNFYKRFGS